jgi:hypothetical protein
VASAATGVTLSGPTAGTAGQASTNFTVGVTPGGGAISGTVTVTPNDGGAGGTFSPTSVSLTTASPTATFTYTSPASAGTYVIGVTNNAGLTNPSSINYVAAAGANALIFNQLQRTTDTSASGVVSYKADPTANYDASALGATSVKTLAGDGSITVKIGTTGSSPQPMVSLKTQSTTVACTALSYIMFAKPTGYSYFGTAGTAGTNIIPAAGHLMKMSRTGTTMKAEVSQDNGNTWTQVYSWTGTPTGTLYAQILCDSGGTIISVDSSGFA